MAAYSEFSVTATGLKPSGIFVSLSPCEFQTCSDFGKLAKQRAGGVLHRERAFAVFALEAFLDLAAEKLREQLHAVTDAEDGHAQLENVFIRQRRVRGINTGRPAGQNDAAGLELGDFRGGRVIAQDCGIDVALADAPRNDLRVLRAEIENDDLFVHEIENEKRFSFADGRFASEKFCPRRRIGLQRQHEIDRPNRSHRLFAH